VPQKKKRKKERKKREVPNIMKHEILMAGWGRNLGFI
jgi:hypothetical protein